MSPKTYFVRDAVDENNKEGVSFKCHSEWNQTSNNQNMKISRRQYWGNESNKVIKF